MDKIYSKSFWNLFGELDSSLNPAAPEQLYDIAGPYLHAGQRILDVGCRDARHLIELVRRHDATGIGLDPVVWRVERAPAPGFDMITKHVVGTQWREHLEEHDHVVSHDLLRLARLRRDPERIIERYGHAAYRTAEASLQWGLQ